MHITSLHDNRKIDMAPPVVASCGFVAGSRNAPRDIAETKRGERAAPALVARGPTLPNLPDSRLRRRCCHSPGRQRGKSLVERLRGPNSGAASERLIIRAAVLATPDPARADCDTWHGEPQTGVGLGALVRFGMISMSARIEAVFGWL
jgi:hypothetical protein